MNGRKGNEWSGGGPNALLNAELSYLDAVVSYAHKEARGQRVGVGLLLVIRVLDVIMCRWANRREFVVVVVLRLCFQPVELLQPVLHALLCSHTKRGRSLSTENACTSPDMYPAPLQRHCSPRTMPECAVVCGVWCGVRRRRKMMMTMKRVQERRVPVVEHRLPARNLDEREHHVLWSLGASVYRWQVVLPRESCAKRLDVSARGIR